VHKSQRPDQKNKCNLYVKNIPFQEGQDINEIEKSLREKFEKFGMITSMVLKIDKAHKKPFGFIAFENHEDAAKALEAMNNADVFGTGEKIYAGWG